MAAVLVSAQPAASAYTREGDGLTTYILENGMEVYLLHTAETPVAQVIFAVKAGYSSQTPATTGVPELYSRLFFNAGEKGLNAFTAAGATELYAGCYNDVVHYSLQSPDLALFDSLKALSRCAIDPRLSNTEIQKTHAVLLEEKKAWAESPSGYINSAMDTVIFSAAPWQFDPGIFPESFERNTIEELRGMLASHAEKYYTPNNSALFIATSQDRDTVLREVKELFGNWKRGAYTVSAPSGLPEATAPQRYALVSDDFSSDYNQFIVQYVGGSASSDMTSIAAWQTAALVLQQNQDLSRALTASETGIDDYTLYNIAFTQASAVPRLIFQCLSDSRKSSPVTQADAILSTLQESWFTDAAVAAAKEQVVSQAVSARTRTSLLLEAVALNWAYGGSSYFYDFPAVTSSLTTEQVAAATSGTPALFVLLHSNNWKTYGRELENAGFTCISAEQAHWYAKAEYLQQRNLALGITDAGSTADVPNLPQETGSSVSSYSNAGNTMYQKLLSNGIPVNIRREQRTQGVTIRITILGGETQYPVSQRGLEAATIQAAAENIRKNISSRSFDATVTEETGLYHSSITITTASPYVDDAIAAIGKALFFETITTSQADGIIYNMQYQWRLQQGSLNAQMQNHAMNLCYPGLPAASWFTTTGDLLTGMTMPVLSKAYAALLSPGRYAVSLIAENPEACLPQLEKVFGTIMQSRNMTATPVTTAGENRNQVPDITRFVTLNHVFMTDIKAEDAGPRPAKLIPTTTFDDPVHYYFKAPSVVSDQYPLFMALMFELEENLNRLWEPGVELHLLQPEDPVVQVIFKSVPQGVDVFPVFAGAFNDLQNNHTAEQVLLLKTRAIPRLFTDNAALMEQCWLYGGNASIYTAQYTILEQAQWETFDAALDILRPTFNILELLSDTRNLKK